MTVKIISCFPSEWPVDLSVACPASNFRPLSSERNECWAIRICVTWNYNYRNVLKRLTAHFQELTTKKQVEPTPSMKTNDSPIKKTALHQKGSVIQVAPILIKQKSSKMALMQYDVWLRFGIEPFVILFYFLCAWRWHDIFNSLVLNFSLYESHIGTDITRHFLLSNKLIVHRLFFHKF